MEAQCLASDEFTALAFDGGYYDSGTYAHQALHCSDPNDASLDWYEAVAAGITKANTVLEEFSSGSAQMRAPARAMRAYFTWLLMDSFGDTPILESVRQKVWSFLVHRERKWLSGLRRNFLMSFRYLPTM